MFTATPQNVTVTEGDKLDIECAVASNAAILIYSWSRPRKVGPSTAIWSTMGVQQDDGGCCYTCTVFFGNRTEKVRLGHSSKARVTVNGTLKSSFIIDQYKINLSFKFFQE